MKETLEPGIEHEFGSLVAEAETVPSLCPGSPEFRQMPEVAATGFPFGLPKWAWAGVARGGKEEMCILQIGSRR
jgi:fluoroacetyl-CoA thioesterase